MLCFVSDSEDCGYGGWVMDNRFSRLYNITLTEIIEGNPSEIYTLEEIDEYLDKIQSRSRSKYCDA